MMPALLILWAGLTTVLVVLLIYRSTLSSTKMTSFSWTMPIFIWLKNRKSLR